MTREAGLSLARVFKTYLEETHGLRILGVPLGSPKFCTDFIMGIMEKAVANSKAVIAGLESGQTILQQLFKTCTAHKMTHLFAADALKSDYDELPNNWNLYHDHGHCLQLHGR